jgi:hypothetical protein
MVTIRESIPTSRHHRSTGAETDHARSVGGRTKIAADGIAGPRNKKTIQRRKRSLAAATPLLITMNVLTVLLPVTISLFPLRETVSCVSPAAVSAACTSTTRSATLVFASVAVLATVTATGAAPLMLTPKTALLESLPVDTASAVAAKTAVVEPL